MKTLPFFLKGSFRKAMQLALEEVISGSERDDIRTQVKGLETLLLVATCASGPPRSGRIGAQKKVGETVLRCHFPDNGRRSLQMHE